MSRLTTKLPLMLYTTKPQRGYNVRTKFNLLHHPDHRPHSAHDSRLVFVCVKRRKHSAHCGSVDPTIQIPSLHMKSKLRYFVVNKGSVSWQTRSLLGRGDLSGGLLVVVDDDTDASRRGTELDLGSLLEGGLGICQGAVEAVLALHQAAFLPGLNLGNLLLILVLLLLAGVELLSYAWNRESSLLVGGKHLVKQRSKGTNIPRERDLTGSLMTEACWRPSPAGAAGATA